jgi:RimJ/RimL family protein N-acetyltransferase
VTAPAAVPHEHLVIGAGALTLRGFVAADSDALLAIRNHRSVRRGMRDGTAIDPRQHRAWVRRNLLDANAQRVFMVNDGERDVGMTLLRNFDETSAEIGVMLVDAGSRRRVAYAASHMTAWYAFEMLGLQSLRSHVPRHNAAALGFNRKCGFVDWREPDADYHYLALTRHVYLTDPVHCAFRRRWPIALRENSMTNQDSGPDDVS